jgi:hypothetical protein
MPRSCGGDAISREEIEITVEKSGRGVRVIYTRSSQTGLAIDNFPLNCTNDFPGSWAIVFGTNMDPKDADLTQKLESITAGWHVDPKTGRCVHGTSWEVRLAARPWRVEEGNEVFAQILPSTDD